MSSPLLVVDGLSVRFGPQPVVHDVRFTLEAGECIGIVGASGSGKSVTSMALMGLLPAQATITGKAMWHGEGGPVDLLAPGTGAGKALRGRHIAMVFQEPMTALDPAYTVGDQVAEVVRTHLGMDRAAARRKVEALFAEVLLPDPARLFDRYPHQLSGGQKQRVMIAMALSCSPGLLICDEPTTALDVLVQREILDLLKDLRKRRRMGMLFITHDLGVVREVADRVLVMHRGEVVEHATVEELFARPVHPYTRGLIACRPDPAVHPVQLPTVDAVMQDPEAFTPDRIPTIPPDIRRAAAEERMKQEPLLRVEGLDKHYPGPRSLFRPPGPDVQVLHDIGFCVYPGETLGVVGGSGSGKTTLGRSILRLLEPNAGHVYYRGVDITTLSPADMRALRREVQIIFQDPYAALNPRITAGAAIAEAMRVHGIGRSDRQRRDAVVALLERVGLEAAHYGRYPHQFSGGQRQRIVIARAIALQPRLVVCDESVAALDVSVQAQVLNLLNELKQEHGLTYVFISHDLNVVKYFCDRILVLERGRQAELGLADTVYHQPRAAYTKALLAAIPGQVRDGRGRS